MSPFLRIVQSSNGLTRRSVGVLAALAIVGVTEKMDNEVSGVGTLLVLSFASILGGIISGRYRIIGLSSLAILSSFVYL